MGIVHGTKRLGHADEQMAPDRPWQILLVEDDPSFGEFLLVGLARKGYDVAFHRGAKAALAEFRQNPFGWDVLITDQHMAGMNGTDLVRAMKEQRPGLPCIVISGDVGSISRQELGDAHDAIVLPKPVTIEDLLGAMGGAVSPASANQVRSRSEAGSATAPEVSPVSPVDLYDTLTGLPNRVLVRDHLRRATAYVNRQSLPFAVLLINVDGFRSINESLGHSIGDAVLMELGARLSGCLRRSDIVGRFGGDEFLLIVHDVHEDSAIRKVVGDIRESLAAPIAVSGMDLRVNISVGMSFHPHDGADGETLLCKAGIALSEAKARKDGPFCRYTEGMGADAALQRVVQDDLPVALAKGHFELHYQPIVAAADGRMVGAEALIRWNHPTLGAISPARFIPIAEANGMIVPIGTWVLKQACREAARWRAAQKAPWFVAVNISAVQIRRADFVATVLRILDETDLPPHLLEIEVTETVLIDDPTAVRASMIQLEAVGVRFAIDDFGTGYSSLSYLVRFPFQKLKIDQSFIRDLHNQPNNRAIVFSILQIAEALNLEVVGEGVEDEHARAFLAENGCDYAQGYHFSRPVPASALLGR